MDNQEYLSIKEFAALANVTQQAIYKRLANPADELCRYLVEFNGKKKLDISALDLFLKTDNSTGCSTGCSTVENKLIDILQQELAAKNEQIDNLTKLLHQEQQLHLLTKQELLALSAPAAENTAEDTAEDTAEPTEITEENTPAEPHKKWWQIWKR